MFCTKCGKPVEEGQQFCTNCGAPVPVSDQQPQTPPAAQPEPAPVAPAKKSPAPKIIAAILALAVLIGAGILAVHLLTGGRQDKPPAGSQEAAYTDPGDPTASPAASPVPAATPIPAPILQTPAPEPTEPAPEPTEPAPPQVSMSDVTHVTATSYLTEAQLGFVHGPDNVVDGKLDKAWVENAEGQGEGESVTLWLDGTYQLSGFVIYAGYQKSAAAYENNSRPARLQLTYSDESSEIFDLEDVNAQQRLTLDTPVETSSVTFTILSVYPGSKYQDTAISEISLF